MFIQIKLNTHKSQLVKHLTEIYFQKQYLPDNSSSTQVYNKTAGDNTQTVKSTIRHCNKTKYHLLEWLSLFGMHTTQTGDLKSLLWADKQCTWAIETT